jgi:hypothetical protein
VLVTTGGHRWSPEQQFVQFKNAVGFFLSLAVKFECRQLIFFVNQELLY